MGFRPHAVMCTYVHNDIAVGVLVSIAGMENEAWFDIAPYDVLIFALTWKQTDTGLMFGIPFIGECVPRYQHLHRKCHRHVHDDDILLRDHAVMDRWPAVHRYRLLAPDFTVGADHNMADDSRLVALVTNRVHLTSLWIEMRMRGEAALQRAAKRVMRNGF